MAITLAVAVVVAVGFVAYRATYPPEGADVALLGISDQRVNGDLRGRVRDGRRTITGGSGQVRFGFGVRNLQDGPLRLRAAPGWASELQRKGIAVTVGWAPPRPSVNSFDSSLGPLVPRGSDGFVVADFRIACGSTTEVVDLTPRFELGVGESDYRAPTRREGRDDDARVVPLAVGQAGAIELRRRRC